MIEMPNSRESGKDEARVFSGPHLLYGRQEFDCLDQLKRFESANTDYVELFLPMDEVCLSHLKFPRQKVSRLSV
jgi:hypothetical protein